MFENREQAANGIVDSHHRIKGTRRLIGSAVLMLSLAGCGAANADNNIPASGPAATQTPYGTPTPVATETPTPARATPTPFAQDMFFPQGQWTCKDVPAFSVLQGDFFWNGDRKFDNDDKSGAVGKVFHAGTACTSFGGDIIVASSSTIESIAGQAADEMRRRGCKDNAGCPDGVTVWSS